MSDTQRFSISFPNEPGQPRIECDDLGTLLEFIARLELEITEDIEAK